MQRLNKVYKKAFKYCLTSENCFFFIWKGGSRANGLRLKFFKSILYSTLFGAEGQAEVKALENAFFMRKFESKIQGWTFERQ